MRTLTIRNLPDELHRLLKDRAGTHRQSINSEAIACLESVLLQGQEDESTLLADLRQLREVGGDFLTDEFLRDAIDEGRA